MGTSYWFPHMTQPHEHPELIPSCPPTPPAAAASVTSSLPLARQPRSQRMGTALPCLGSPPQTARGRLLTTSKSSLHSHLPRGAFPGHPLKLHPLVPPPPLHRPQFLLNFFSLAYYYFPYLSYVVSTHPPTSMLSSTKGEVFVRLVPAPAPACSTAR